MNRSELVETLAGYFDGNRTDAARALNAVVHAVSSATAAGERVAITGFGVFERLERPARTVRNPRTGERLDVPATAVPRFRAGTELKAYVSGQRAVPEFGAGQTARRAPAPATGTKPSVRSSPATAPAVEDSVVVTGKSAKPAKSAKPTKTTKKTKAPGKKKSDAKPAKKDKKK